MNKQLTSTEVSELLTSTSVASPPPIPSMTRYERLHHWARIVSLHPNPITMLHGLEHISGADLCYAVAPDTIFSIAAADGVFRSLGLTRPDPMASIQFFDLSRNDVHYLACDCCGQLTNTQMAVRIRNLTYFTSANG